MTKTHRTRRERISAIEKEVLKLASKLEISIGKPPSHKDHDSSELVLGNL